MLDVILLLLLTLPFLLIALGRLEVRVCQAHGIPLIEGTLVAEAQLETRPDPLRASALLTLGEHFSISGTTLFESSSGLEQALACVTRIELAVRSLQLRADRRALPDEAWRGAAMEIWVNGEPVPFSVDWSGRLAHVRIDGELLTHFKEALSTTGHFGLRVSVRFLLREATWPRGQVDCTFSAQPTFVLSNGVNSRLVRSRRAAVHPAQAVHIAITP